MDYENYKKITEWSGEYIGRKVVVDIINHPDEKNLELLSDKIGVIAGLYSDIVDEIFVSVYFVLENWIFKTNLLFLLPEDKRCCDNCNHYSYTSGCPFEMGVRNYTLECVNNKFKPI